MKYFFYNTISISRFRTYVLILLTNIFTINKSINSISLDDYSEPIEFSLSKNGQNVVVLMLDRAMGEYVPYILNEKPELAEQFNVFSIPTLVIMKDGEIIHQSSGARPKAQILNLLND